METHRLLDLIEYHANEIASGWVKDVRSHPHTTSYRHVSEDRLRDDAFALYSHLGTWLIAENKQIEKSYERLGSERFHQGFELSEVVKAIMLARRRLWSFLLSESVSDSPARLYQMLELYNRVILFFDRAIHCTVKGYEWEARLSQRVAAAMSR